MIKPNDLDIFYLEACQRIEIDDFVRKANEQVKLQLIQTQIRALDVELKLTTSKTRFNGKRYWFICPTCNSRAGVIYKHPTSREIGCRKCMKMLYLGQRYK